MDSSVAYHGTTTRSIASPAFVPGSVSISRGLSGQTSLEDKGRYCARPESVLAPPRWSVHRPALVAGPEFLGSPVSFEGLRGALWGSRIELLPSSSRTDIFPRLSPSPAPFVTSPGLVEMSGDLLKQTEERFQKSIEACKQSFNTIRTGRASTALLDRVVVEYYGADTPLKQLATISTPDSSTIMIQVFDKGSVSSIEKAISTSDIGLTPNSDGSTIRLNIPPLTQERRKELSKTVAKLAEQGRVALRNVRRDSIDGIRKKEKNGDLSKDLARDEEEKVSKLTDKFMKVVDGLLADKEKEILAK
mmetsp:Transcript_30938/g.50042  ORF Transcript_30938/g.50042 Transcript_30938/m.50042 type:complete len:304 (-) Transcript_30938:345-1256(-)|eukprot:CAMPEP_0184643598 /NCGR_PEP_ID=MMETSP0308-20130426/431_1 /TAXON_ID=38269 /ORGANISM="Gloeochaete witrockiana, Strain SAG 46.84" /LENGTH=303 /DNA_ID=CAMNT_0027071627 /DNA_START=186 /DNA_END=1097 /DNA_ORIENTATION=-